MIFINTLNINSQNNTIQVSVETTSGYNITSVKLWTHLTYKGSNFINLNYKLSSTNNKEVFTITTQDLGVSNMNGLFFIEFTSNSPNSNCSSCDNTVIGTTANINNIKNSILDDILKLKKCNNNIFTCDSCGNDAINIINKDIMITSLYDSLSFGYFETAVDIYNSLLIITTEKECESCFTDEAVLFKGIGYGIINNNLTLT